MQRERLTLDRIRRFTCRSNMKQDFFWDTEVRQFGVRVTIGGAKSFIFESKLFRRTVRMTIGDVSTWDLDRARAEAKRLGMLVDQGIDPRKERSDKRDAFEAERQRARRIKSPALGAWATYISARSKKWGARSLADHQAVAAEGGKPKTRGRKKGEADTTKPGILHSLLSQPLERLDAKAVCEWLRAEAATRPTHAALAFRLLRAFLNWCAKQDDFKGMVHAGACDPSIARDELPKRSAKSDCLQREQLEPWFRCVRDLANPVHSAYLQTLLLTGARREELAALRWEDVDFKWKSLTIRDKVDGKRTIPLTPYVASLLRDLRHHHETNVRGVLSLHGADDAAATERAERALPWVFSSPSAETGRIREPRIAHNKALSAAGLPPLSLHGLRRSFGTLSEWVMVPTGIAAQIMGHKPSAIAEKHYRSRPLDLLRMWHTSIEAWILTQAGIPQPENENASTPLLASPTPQITG